MLNLDDTFLTGGDISLLAKMESLGQVYFDEGRRHPLLDIFRGHGCNCMRIRLWVNPSREDVFVNDLAYTIELGRRIKAAGFYLMLALQYSDEWANPGVQNKPAAWSGLPFPSLVRTVEEYTQQVVTALRNAGALPDMIQLGAEITDGMLWPDGQALGNPRNYESLGELLLAGERGVAKATRGVDAPKIVIHIDRGGDWLGAEGFFDELTARKVPFDIIGLSFYPFLHGSLSHLKRTVDNAAVKFHKPVMVVETMYPYHGVWEQLGTTHPPTPEGQRRFLAELIQAVKTVPNGLGKGILYWAPEWQETAGLRSSWTGRTLFDKENNSLPGLDVLGKAAYPPATPLRPGLHPPR